MMRVTIKNAQAIASLDMLLAPGPNVVAGPNEAGKSTACHVVGSLLVRDAKLQQRSKAEIEAFVRRGAKAAVAGIGDEQGRIGMRWPDGELTVDGDEPPAASPVAVGRLQPARLPPKERAAVLVELLKALPGEDEWLAACEKAGIILAGVLWQEIEKIGWDGAAKFFADRAREDKGAWKHCTKQPGYPSKGAETWQPDGCDYDLMTADLAGAEREVGAVKARRDKAQRDIGAKLAERDRLVALAEKQDEREQALGRAQQANHDAGAKVREAEERLAKLAVALPEERCPHCRQPIAIHPDKPLLRKPAPQASVDPETYAAAQRGFENARLALIAAGTGVTAAERDAAESQEAARALAKIPPLEDVSTGALDVELTEAIAWRDAVKVTQEARAIHHRIVELTTAAQLARPEGLRKTKLAEVLGLMNDAIDELVELAGWKKLVVGPELEISYGGVPWANLSDGAKWRVDALLAFYLAEVGNSDVVILDRADVLDVKGRNGLLLLAREYEFPVLIGMTLGLKEAERLAGAGFPVTYLQDGHGIPVGENAGAVAAE